MRITAKVDYAVRATVELVGAPEGPRGLPMPTKGTVLAEAQDIPAKFLETILSELRHAGIVSSRRGADGGYWLARPPDQVTIADVIRAVEGPLADVRGVRPDQLGYDEDQEVLQRMWIAVRANLRAVLEHTTVADLHAGKLDPEVDAIVDRPGAWDTR